MTGKALLKELAAAVGASRVVAGERELGRYGRDFAGHPLGPPLAAVRPSEEGQVQALVRWARRRKTTLTPVGSLTSFWASARSAGGVAVDLSAMRKVLALDEGEMTVRAQAGATVAELDSALRARRFSLEMAPDGFGDATLASMVSNDTSAGLGMFLSPASAQIAGLRAVLGTGEALAAGACGALGLAAFARSGLPDPTGLLLASEGALGIVTELTLRVRPVRPAAALELRLEPSPESYRRLLDAGARMRAAGSCDGWVNQSSTSTGALLARIQVSGADPEELASRRRLALGILRAARLGEASVLPEGPRWPPPPPQKERWEGVSAQLPYGRMPELYRLWEDGVGARVKALAFPDGFLRTYFGVQGAAALFGWSHRGGAAEEASRALAEDLRARLAGWGVPYRIGSAWRRAMAGRLDPVYARLMGRLKAVMDPDGVLSPGVGVFGLAPRRAK